jgi:hypothetical protein
VPANPSSRRRGWKCRHFLCDLCLKCKITNSARKIWHSENVVY